MYIVNPQFNEGFTTQPQQLKLLKSESVTYKVKLATSLK